MEAQTIDLKTSVVSLRKDGIMHVHIKAGIEMQRADVVEVVEAIGKLGNRKKFPILIDCDEFSLVDKEAWIYAESKEANIYTLADAVAYHSLAHKLLADFYKNHNNSAIPTKVFENNESAITWLKTFKNKRVTEQPFS
jgi:hypothetical protein